MNDMHISCSRVKSALILCVCVCVCVCACACVCVCVRLTVCLSVSVIAAAAFLQNKFYMGYASFNRAMKLSLPDSSDLNTNQLGALVGRWHVIRQSRELTALDWLWSDHGFGPYQPIPSAVVML